MICLNTKFFKKQGETVIKEIEIELSMPEIDGLLNKIGYAGRLKSVNIKEDVTGAFVITISGQPKDFLLFNEEGKFLTGTAGGKLTNSLRLKSSEFSNIEVSDGNIYFFSKKNQKLTSIPLSHLIKEVTFIGDNFISFNNKKFYSANGTANKKFASATDFVNSDEFKQCEDTGKTFNIDGRKFNKKLIKF